MMNLSTIDSKLFNAIQNIDLSDLMEKDLTNVLPFLAKTLLNSSFVKRQQLLQMLYPIRRMNDILSLLLAPVLDNFETQQDLSFESCSSSDRLRIVASEYMRIQEHTRQLTLNPSQTPRLLRSELFDNPIYVDEISYCLCILLFKSVDHSIINILHMSEALLHIKHGSTYIMRLVINMPDSCQEVCNSLITHGERQDEGASFDEVSEQRAQTVRMLCLVNPSISYSVRSMTIQLCKMPSLTLMITLDQLAQPLEDYDKLVQALAEDGQGSDERMEIDNHEKPEERLSQAFRGLENSYDSAVAFITGIMLGVDEAPRVWFAQYTKMAQQKRIDQSHFTVLTKFRSQLLAYITRLFNSLLDDEVSRENLPEGNLEESEHNSIKIKETSRSLNKKLIRATATLRLFCALRGIGSLKLNQEESELLLRLVTLRLPVDRTTVNYATTGVCTLLTCSALIANQKEERRAAEWLKWLIKESNYSDSRYSSHAKYSLSELLSLIGAHFENNENNQIAELVCATLSMKLQIKASVSKCKSLFAQEVLNNQKPLDIKVTDVKADTISDLAPVHCIQFSSIQHWLNIDGYISNSSETNDCLNIKRVFTDDTTQTVKVKAATENQTNLMKQLEAGVQQIETDQVTLAKTLFAIIGLPKEEILAYINPFIETLSKLIRLPKVNSPNHKKLVQATSKLWWKFNTVSPRKLWVMTVNALMRPQNVRLAMDVRPVEYSWDELASDPLIVLRCDSRVFRCVDSLHIVLHILSAFLAASRRCLQEQSSRSKDVRSLEELKTTLILAQTSAAIQILLESCIPNDDEQEAISKRETGEILSLEERFLLERFDSSVNCICEHLHQVYIADTNLAKLVHFQTYPSELLSTTSDRIPSMHICLDFIPELLSQPDLSKQVFVIELTSHLCEKYAITKSLNVAKLCFNVSYTLLQLLPSPRRALFFIPVLPALLRICKVFPILRDDAHLILSQINQITLAHMASTSSRLSLGSEKPFEGLEKMSWREAKKLMSTFSLHEALYLCIQRCLIDLNKLKETTKEQSLFIEPQLAPVYNTIFAYGNHVINPGS